MGNTGIKLGDDIVWKIFRLLFLLKEDEAKTWLAAASIYRCWGLVGAHRSQ